MDAHLARLEPVLASQHGLVTIDQLREHDVTDAERHGLVKRKVLRRVRPRVFGLVGGPDSWERGLLAVVLSIEGAVASHSAAARLWRFAVEPEITYEVTIARTDYLVRRGVNVHRSGTVDDEDVARRNGITTTSFERTLCDCTGLLSERQLGRVLDGGLRRNVASLTRVKRCAERIESGPGRYMSRIRALLLDRGVGFDPGGSRAELDILDVLRQAGVPQPVQQHRVNVQGRTYRPDFAWPDALVFAEYYGMPFHTGPAAVAADSERLTALSAAGWTPLIFTGASSEREIVDRTLEALQRRGVGRESKRDDEKV